jgi:lysophospholipase L1-like esterase
MRHVALSLAFAPLSPLLIAQGRRVQRDTPRLPPAHGPVTGESPGADDAPALSVLLFGESTVAGVGADHHGEGLAGQVGEHLASATGRRVRWHALGLSGATVARAHASLIHEVPREKADLVILAFGVNDTIEHTAPRRFAIAVERLIADIRERAGPAPVLVSAAPPMRQFPNLPRPLNLYLGARAALLDAAAGRALPRDAAQIVPRLAIERRLFARDGFHPSPAGYRVWAQLLVEAARTRAYVP